MKKSLLKNIFLFFFIIFFHQIISKSVYAVRYSLIAPTETLTRGQTVTFTINIDTQGATVTNANIGMTYETQYLEYVNTIAGDAFSDITTTPQEGGKLIFQGSSSGFNGSGTFAQVNFKIIADAPGSSQLCVLWEVTPTQPFQPSQVPQTYQPSPTQLPTSGQNKPVFMGLIIASFFIIGASIYFIFYKKLSFQPKLPLKKISSGESKSKPSPQQESIKRK